MAKTKSVSKSQKPKEVKEKPEEKAPKRIDIGKIMALKRQGGPMKISRLKCAWSRRRFQKSYGST